ncbi:glycoside hydrolase domain-containing protein [Streptococcus sp. X13SY08]|uniref:glycoside hydrolase domain-containing protein n=1 Tax=Streptococcus sp. X13SY08 TaxID=1676616 RepID=UPI002E8160C2|nr:glycoside hydrolase domain-containing protein [Streptococcus sp. X13SY08]
MLSCLGFYPLCPGDGSYKLGIPQFDKIQLQLVDGHKLTITTKNNHDHYDFACSAILDGNPIQQLSHDQLMKSSKPDFTLKHPWVLFTYLLQPLR